jgi:hypothetical protein
MRVPRSSADGLSFENVFINVSTHHDILMRFCKPKRVVPIRGNEQVLNYFAYLQ